MNFHLVHSWVLCPISYPIHNMINEESLGSTNLLRTNFIDWAKCLTILFDEALLCIERIKTIMTLSLHLLGGYPFCFILKNFCWILFYLAVFFNSFIHPCRVSFIKSFSKVDRNIGNHFRQSIYLFIYTNIGKGCFQIEVFTCSFDKYPHN